MRPPEYIQPDVADKVARTKIRKFRALANPNLTDAERLEVTGLGNAVELAIGLTPGGDASYLIDPFIELTDALTPHTEIPTPTTEPKKPGV